MNGAPFGVLLIGPALVLLAIGLAVGIGIGGTLPRGEPTEPEARQCIVIDMRSRPTPPALARPQAEDPQI